MSSRKHTSISKTQQIICRVEKCQMKMNPGENPLDLKVYGEKTFAVTMALLRGSTVTRGRLRGPGGSGMAGPH